MGKILVKHQEGSNPITMVYDAANRIETNQQGAVVTTYTSDANGNLTAQNAGGSKTTFTYDYENRLKTILHADSTRSSYTYAGGFPVQGEGLRRSHHAPGGNLTTTIWDGSDYLMEKGGGATVRYVVSDGEMLAEKRSRTRLAFVPDPLGSVIGLLSSSQAFTDTFAFWPYGEERVRTGSTPTPFRWLGTLGYFQDSDWAYYIRARYELAVLGRWLTEDPLRPAEIAVHTGTLIGGGRIRNSQFFSVSSPLTLTDPTGLAPSIPALIIGELVLLVVGLSCAACANLIRSVVGSLPTPRRGRPDRWQHCLADCMITSLCGIECGLIAVPSSELGGTVEAGDVLANIDGFLCGIVPPITQCLAGPPWALTCAPCCFAKGYGRHK